MCGDGAIVAILNRLGYRTGAGNTWKESRVRSLRDYHKIPAHDPEKPRSWITLTDAAQRSGVSATVIRKLLKQGLLPGHQVVPRAPWVIEPAHLDLPRVQAVIQTVNNGRTAP